MRGVIVILGKDVRYDFVRCFFWAGKEQVVKDRTLGVAHGHWRWHVRKLRDTAQARAISLGKALVRLFVFLQHIESFKTHLAGWTEHHIMPTAIAPECIHAPLVLR